MKTGITKRNIAFGMIVTASDLAHEMRRKGYSPHVEIYLLTSDKLKKFQHNEPGTIEPKDHNHISSTYSFVVSPPEDPSLILERKVPGKREWGLAVSDGDSSLYQFLSSPYNKLRRELTNVGLGAFCRFDSTFSDDDYS